MSQRNGRSRPSRLPLACSISLLMSGVLLLGACGSAGETPSQGAAPTTVVVETPAQAATVPASAETEVPTQAPAATEPAGEAATPTTEAEPEAEAPTPTATKKAAGALDPCGLLTRADAEAALGMSLPEMEQVVIGPFDSCSHSDGTMAKYAQFQIAADYYTKDNFGEQQEAAAKMLDEQLQQVSGVGDEAYWLAGVLYVLSGRHTMSFLVVTPDQISFDEAQKEQALQKSLQISTDLARVVIPRLP